jgi:carboxyl-terminal processing protease
MRYLILLLLALTSTVVRATNPEDFRSDALSVETLINDNYAYLDRLPNGHYQLTERLRAEAGTVNDQRSLLAFLERAIMLLADHHAITGKSFPNSWAVVPSYADLWVECKMNSCVITAIKDASPAAKAGINVGTQLVAIGDLPMTKAVAGFWADLGVEKYSDDQASYAARILAAGRRDRQRSITTGGPRGDRQTYKLASLYALDNTAPPVTTFGKSGVFGLRINNSLGDDGTIAAFDQAMAQAKPDDRILIDLTNTPSGGTTTIARAIMGWFVQSPHFYQMHRVPSEERRTGIARQWVEQVLPRDNRKFHPGPITVRVGRWTGSMGEGLAIGLSAIGAKVEGDPMSGLLGSIEDISLANSGLIFKLPTERLMTVDGKPREGFQPAPPSD